LFELTSALQALLWPVLGSGQQVVTTVQEGYAKAVVRRQSVLDRHTARDIVKEGFLIKRAVKTGSNWRKRYMKLYDNAFLGYCDSSESAPKGLIHISADHFVADSKLRPFAFLVRLFSTSQLPDLSEIATTASLTSFECASPPHWCTQRHEHVILLSSIQSRRKNTVDGGALCSRALPSTLQRRSSRLAPFAVPFVCHSALVQF
jgi:hypothetical protein